MPGNVITLARSSDFTIEQVFADFLAHERTELDAKRLRTCADVLDLLRDHMNGYAYESLSTAEGALFRRHFDAEGEAHREFCQIFGPEKIVEHLDTFLGWFMVSKVMAGLEFKKASGTVTKRLVQWLAAQGYVEADDAGRGAASSGRAARDLPKAERAARMLAGAAAEHEVEPDALADEDWVEFDHLTLTKVAPGELWFEVWDTGGARQIGPVPAPITATKLLRKGWAISCGLARIGGIWRMVEVANVYPE
jgi:hypothetical protein